MAFIAVFLGVLYAQRGATVGYQVHSTIAAVVMPGSSVLQSTADVYSWLQNLLQVRATGLHYVLVFECTACTLISLPDVFGLFSVVLSCTDGVG
jgi:aconitase A